jgi:tRNA threonylcarbamoyladenosine biosynthesis protein TsaB
MLVLAFDTAGRDCAVALARGSASEMEVLSRASEALGRGHAERLLSMIAEMLGEAGVTYQNLDRIAVTTGPGSFTGVRVGVAAARALALALDIPAVGVGSLEALAFSAMQGRKAGTVIAVLDARRGEIYAFAREVVSGNVLVAPVAASAEVIAARLSGAARPLILIGSGAPLLQAALEGVAAEIAGLPECPAIADVARLGARADPGAPPLPNYARGADAKPQAGSAVARREASTAFGSWSYEDTADSRLGSAGNFRAAGGSRRL